MLEEAADDADHADAIAHAGDARAQAADAAHDEIDLHAGLRRAIERIDHLGIDERVHLRDDARRPARARVLGFALDQLEEPLAHVRRRDEQLAVESLPRDAR